MKAEEEQTKKKTKTEKRILWSLNLNNAIMKNIYKKKETIFSSDRPDSRNKVAEVNIFCEKQENKGNDADPVTVGRKLVPL